MKFTFTNKEEYLAYRSNWKAEYKALSQTIRERKWLHSRYSTIANKANLEVGTDYPNINKYFDYIKMLSDEDTKYKEIRAKQNWRISKEKLSLTATVMLQELKDAKKEANRQYLEQKQSLQAVSV
jgi:hypothetical protein